MKQPHFAKVLLFVLVKWILFFLVLVIARGYNPFSNHTLVLILLMLLPILIATMLVFSAVYYYLFRIRGNGLFIACGILVLIGEYFMYVLYTDAKQVDVFGVYNAIFTILIFCMFFFRELTARQKKL